MSLVRARERGAEGRGEGGRGAAEGRGERLGEGRALRKSGESPREWEGREEGGDSRAGGAGQRS